MRGSGFDLNYEIIFTSNNPLLFVRVGAIQMLELMELLRGINPNGG